MQIVMQKVYLHVVVALVVVYVFFKYLLGFFMPFILGLAIALLLEPLVRFLITKGRFNRSLASFVALLIFVLAVAALIRWGAFALYEEILEFIDAAPGYIASLPFDLTNILERAEQWIGESSIEDSTQSSIQTSIQASMQAVIFVPGFLIIILLVLFSAFFFSRDRDSIFAFVAKWCPSTIAEYAKPIGKKLHTAAAGLLKTELILVAMVATISILFLWMIGAPYVIMPGIVVALLDSLPIVGAGLVLWPWAAYLAIVGRGAQAAGLLVLYGIIAVIRNFLGPKILGEQIDMHPLAAVISIFVGIKAFGAVGIIVGPALVIAITVMLSKY